MYSATGLTIDLEKILLGEAVVSEMPQGPVPLPDAALHSLNVGLDGRFRGEVPAQDPEMFSRVYSLAVTIKDMGNGTVIQTV